MEKETKFLIDIVKQASGLINKDFEVKAKNNKGDLVTNFDYEIENFIIGKVKEKYPNFDIVSEEFNSEKGLTENCFVLDPIDGTINFANGLPLWGIQIAYIKNGKTCASVLYLPKLNELYYADKTGAYLNDKKIKVNKKPIENSLFVVQCSKNYNYYSSVPNHFSNFREYYCSAVSHCWLANGGLSGVVFLKDNAWDYLPGHYLVKQAGGALINKDNIHIAASSKKYAEFLLKEVALKSLEE